MIRTILRSPLRRWGLARRGLTLWVCSAAACSGTNSPPGGTQVGGPDQVTEVTVSGPAGASVTVPPGARATPVSIRISQNEADAPALDRALRSAGPLFSITPHGAKFVLPVTVRIPIDPSAVDDHHPLFVMKAEPGGPWAPVTPFIRDGNMVQVEVTDFSLFTVAQPVFPFPGPAKLSIEPIDPGYTSDASGNWTYAGTPDTSPVLIRLRVALGGTSPCPAGSSPAMFTMSLAATARTQGGTFGFVNFITPGWPASATEIDLPLSVFDERGLRDVLDVVRASGPPPWKTTFSFVAGVWCKSAGGNYLGSNLLSNEVHHDATFASPVKLGLAGGPDDVTVGVGTTPVFKVGVIGGPQPATDSDQYTVDWQRSDDGGRTWRPANDAIAYQLQLPGDQYFSYNFPWSFFTGRPAEPGDDGALFQAKACYSLPPGLQQYSDTTTDCVFSRPARLTVGSTSLPVFTLQPRGVLASAGSTATFTAAASGAPAPTLHWQSLAPGASAWVDIGGGTGGSYTTPAAGLTDNGTQFRAVASNSVGSTTSEPAILAVSPAPVAPTIQVQPFDVTAEPGSTASFVVVAHGSDPLSYQWRRDGAVIPGVTGPRLDLPGVAVADSGAHLDVVVSNPAGSITSTPATLTVSTIGPPPVAPTISQQPVSGTTTAPYPALFTVVASGTPPLSYQWLLNGVAIPGANDASYGTGLTTIGQAPETYSVVVWNAGGAVVSSGAILTVVAGAPLMVQSVTPAAGSTGNPSLAATIGATFSEILDCTSIDATSFQVFEGSRPVPGTVDCTNPTLTFTPSQPLPTRTTLHARLGSDIRDKFGIALGAPYEWTFGIAPWTRQLGGARHDEPLGVRTDTSGNVLVSGYTSGGLDGIALTGIVDAFAVKLSPSGAKLWTRQLGADGAFTYGYGIGADTAGNVYLAGHTNGTLPGNTSTGTYDLFLRKFDPDGNVLWTLQHGATLAVQVAGLAVDADGNSLVVGWTQGSLDGQSNVGGEDVFVVKYDTTGTRLWTRMFGSPATDYATSVALDLTGNILVAGYTRGNIDGNGNAGIDDLYVVKLTPDGSTLWARQLGSSAMDQAWSVAGDVAGNVYVAGWTRGSLDGQTSHGGQDIVVVKYDRDGVKQWTQQLGTSADDWAAGITVDRNGGVCVVGGTHGPLDGGSNTSATQLYVVKLDPAGTVRWVFQEGGQTNGYDLAETVTTDGLGNVFAAGITDGNLDGNINAGDYDAFVVKVQQDGTPR